MYDIFQLEVVAAPTLSKAKGLVRYPWDRKNPWDRKISLSS